MRVRTRVCVPVPVVFIADRLTLKVPAATLGVPEMTPVDELIDKPLGSPVALKDVG